MKFPAMSCALLCAIALPAVADEDIDPRAVIEARQSALRDIGAAFKGINDELRKSKPALATIRERAQQIDQRWQRHEAWFPEGTGQDADIINAAKDDIWDEPTKFDAARQAMSAELAQLLTVVRGEDLGAIRKQTQTLARTCKGCHDRFREED